MEKKTWQCHKKLLELSIEPYIITQLYNLAFLSFVAEVLWPLATFFFNIKCVSISILLYARCSSVLSSLGYHGEP